MEENKTIKVNLKAFILMIVIFLVIIGVLCFLLFKKNINQENINNLNLGKEKLDVVVQEQDDDYEDENDDEQYNYDKVTKQVSQVIDIKLKETKKKGLNYESYLCSTENWKIYTWDIDYELINEEKYGWYFSIDTLILGLNEKANNNQIKSEVDGEYTAYYTDNYSLITYKQNQLLEPREAPINIVVIAKPQENIISKYKKKTIAQAQIVDEYHVYIKDFNDNTLANKTFTLENIQNVYSKLHPDVDYKFKIGDFVEIKNPEGCDEDDYRMNNIEFNKLDKNSISKLEIKPEKSIKKIIGKYEINHISSYVFDSEGNFVRDMNCQGTYKVEDGNLLILTYDKKGKYEGEIEYIIINDVIIKNVYTGETLIKY